MLTFLTSFVNLLLIGTVSGNPHALNSFISYYEPVADEVMMPRDNGNKDGEKDLYYHFQAFGRKFELELTIGSSVLSPFAEIQIHEQNVTKYESAAKMREYLVEGRLVGYPTSFVHGDIYEGFFAGIITVPHEQYFVESSTNYFEKAVNFKRVIFRRSDVKYEVSPSHLGNDIVGNHVVRSTLKRHHRMHRSNLRHSSTSSTFQQKKSRHGMWPRNECTVTLVADHTFYKNIANKNTLTAVTEMVKMVQEASNIFSKIDFDEDAVEEEIRLKVHKVTVWKKAGNAEYTFGDVKATPTETLLNLTYGYDFSMYCLAVVFVHRPWVDFSVAYEGSPDLNEVGGICAPNLDEGSYNIAVASSLDKNDGVVPAAVRYIVVAHVIGHSFGSPHDPPTTECAHYIMAVLTSMEIIYNLNNAQFSPCSIAAMRSMINAKGDCFIRSEREAVCGNTIVEDDEECDCGQTEQCSEIDPCCIPRGHPGECQLIRAEYEYQEEALACSPRHEKCCFENCTYDLDRNQKQCDYHEQCKESGEISKPKPDGTRCLGGDYVCFRGKCKREFETTTSTTEEQTKKQTTMRYEETTIVTTKKTNFNWVIVVVIAVILLIALVVCLIVLVVRHGALLTDIGD